MENNKKNKKIVFIIIAVVIVLAILITGVIFFIKNINKGNPEKVLEEYMGYINEGKYEELYNFLSDSSKNKISEEDFINRNKKIYSGIEMSDLKVNVTNVEKAVNGTAKVTYDTKMDSLAGEIDFTNEMEFVKNKKNEYVIDWSSNCIFPNLNSTDKVRISTQSAKRGNICYSCYKWRNIISRNSTRKIR